MNTVKIKDTNPVNRVKRRWFLPILMLVAAGFVEAQSVPRSPVIPVGIGGSRASLTYIPGSSVKLEQLIGDKDWATGRPTASQTIARFHILGDDLGFSFESNGKLIFLFGDTMSSDKSEFHYGAGDPLAWSTSTDPEGGLLLNFYTDGEGAPLFVDPPGVPMGPSDVPNDGISLDDGIYLVCKTGADQSLDDPNQYDYSVLVRFEEATGTFSSGRTISRLPGGHFIRTALHASGADIFMFGLGETADVYLAEIPASGFGSGVGTRYFAGLAGDQPTWTGIESNAVPLNGPSWPNDTGTIGNVSVIYSKDLGLWLMTFSGGQTPKTTGVYFSYATAPWGPWREPQLIFNKTRDNGAGVFIHDPGILPDPPGDGLNGPVTDDNDPYLTPGRIYAPFMIERFTSVVGDTLKISYTMSTWNPYTVVRMRSEFKITHEKPVLPFR